MPEKKWQDYIKKVDFSDFKVLAIGLVLLVIPLGVLSLMLGSGKTRDLSRERLKSTVDRKKIFNFAQNKKVKRSLPANPNKSGAGTGWFDETPEKKVKRELEEAFKVVQQSSRRERFPPGTNQLQKKAYRAENNPLITEGNGNLEMGNLDEAERLFEVAVRQAGNDAFLKVHALGGLCEVYERKGETEKFHKAFELFMDWVAKLPPEAGGGDLKGTVRNAYKMLAELKKSADPAKFAQEVSKVDLVQEGQITEAQLKQGLDQSLTSFPARFDD
jgi:Ca2+-binding EF-hand superfamily protein